MIKRESSTGYNAGEWFSAGIGDAMKGYYKFVLDWSNAASPTITVTKEDTPNADTPDVTTQMPSTYIMVRAFARNSMREAIISTS